MERLLSNDNVLKIVSLLLAVLLWLMVTSTQNQVDKRTFERVPIEFINLGTGLTRVSQSSQTASFTVQGGRRALGRLRKSDFKVRVDLKDQGPGELELPVEVSPIRVGIGADVIAVTPERIRVVLDRFVSKLVPVDVREVGTLGEDLKWEKPLLSLQEVKVEGPEQKIRSVVAAVGQVDMTGVRPGQNLRRTVGLKPVDDKGKEVVGVNLVQSAVDVDLRVSQLSPGRIVTVTPPQPTGRPAPGFQVGGITIEPSAVKLRGPRDLHETWNQVVTEAISVEGASQPITLEARVLLPPGAELAEPDRVRVTVSIIEERVTKTLDDVAVAVWNLPSNFKAEVNPGRVTLTLEGPRSVMAAVRADELGIHVDVENLGPGLHRLQVRLALPEGMSLVSIQPQEVQVLIEER